jgi:hypothetical protein
MVIVITITTSLFGDTYHHFLSQKPPLATEFRTLATRPVPLNPLLRLDCYKTTSATGKIHPLADI